MSKGNVIITRMKILMDRADIERTLRRMALEIIENNRGTENLCLVGIQSGGVSIAEELKDIIKETEGKDVPVGVLDISFYRDDIDLRGTVKVKKTEIPISVDNLNVVLVDDVLYTGRSIRAAMDALMDIGRPARIQLAVLIDRGHRELPIKADYVGKVIETPKDVRVEVVVEGQRPVKVLLIKDGN